MNDAVYKAFEKYAARVMGPGGPDRMAAMDALLAEQKREYQEQCRAFVEELRNDIAEIESTPNADESDVAVLDWSKRMLKKYEAELD